MTNHTYVPAIPDWWITTASGRTYPVGAWKVESNGALTPMIPGERDGVPILRPVDEHFLKGRGNGGSAVTEPRRR